MTDETFSSWRSREGSALLVAYGVLVAAVSAAFAYSPQTEHVYAVAPYWVRLVPIAVCLALVGCVGLFPALRNQAYRLQLPSVGTFLLVVVLVFLDRRNGSSWLFTVVICLFGVQYAFMRWQELVAAYGGTIAAFAAYAAVQGVFLSRETITELEVLAGVALVCVTLSAVRLRSMYRAANERAALELQAAELRRQTERNARIAVTDHLTGLFNRAGMNDVLDRALALAKRTGARVALLYLDLDGFKEINDVCGHDAGDLVLVEAALRIQYLLRAGESAARIGGDEFVIVLPSVQTLDEPRALAKRIEDAFTEPFNAGKFAFPISASIGMAWSGELACTRSALLSAADQSMYDAKRWHKLERAHAASVEKRGA